MSTVSGAPPTALERLRSNMRENQMQSRRQNAEFEASRTNFRQSMRVILDEEQITKLPMTGKDLQEFTNIQFYASFSFVNFASFCCVLSVTFCLGWMGWGRDIKDDYKSIHDEYQVRLVYIVNDVSIFDFQIAFVAKDCYKLTSDELTHKYILFLFVSHFLQMYFGQTLVGC